MKTNLFKIQVLVVPKNLTKLSWKCWNFQKFNLEVLNFLLIMHLKHFETFSSDDFWEGLGFLFESLTASLNKLVFLAVSCWTSCWATVNRQLGSAWVPSSSKFEPLVLASTAFQLPANTTHSASCFKVVFKLSSLYFQASIWFSYVGCKALKLPWYWVLAFKLHLSF